jgi:uncharacterized protein (TIGR02246 family)
MRNLALIGILFTLVICSAAQAFQNPDDAALQQRQKDWSAAWDKHDAKQMAAIFSADADVMNPFGRKAKGRDEIEKLFAEEHAGPMSKSSYKGVVETIRYIGKEVAIIDVAGEITGMIGPDGAAAEPFKHHVTWIAVKKDGQWTAVAARAFVPAPKPNAAEK